MKVAWVCVLLMSCTKPNPTVCCTTPAQCEQIHVEDLRPCGADLVCRENQCVESSDDAAVDAIFDAQGVHVFDVAYPKQWRFAVDTTMGGYFLIVNTGATTLDMSTLQLKSLTYDTSTIVLVTATPLAVAVPPGSSAGALSMESTNLLINTQLVPEPRVNTTANFMTLGLQTHVPGNYDINVAIVLRLGGVDIPMSMVINVLDTQITYADPVLGFRGQVYAP